MIKYLLRRRVNIQKKQVKETMSSMTGGIINSTSEISLQRLNDFDKYLSRLFCVTEVSSSSCYVLLNVKVLFYIFILFIECFWSKQSPKEKESLTSKKYQSKYPFNQLTPSHFRGRLNRFLGDKLTVALT